MLDAITKSAETQPIPFPETVVGTSMAYQARSEETPTASAVDPGGATSKTGYWVPGPLRPLTYVVVVTVGTPGSAVGTTPDEGGGGAEGGMNWSSSSQQQAHQQDDIWQSLSHNSCSL